MAISSKSSPARIAANRANAQKSTGPRTEAGKARSRANAVKHGLTGAGVALPNEDAGRIEAEFLQAQEEFAPTTLAGMRLVRDVATIWVRQDRARRHEAMILEAQARQARANFDQARVDRADALIDGIEANPRASRRALLAMPEGVDRLVDELVMLLGEVTGLAPAWSEAHHRRLDALFGYRVGDLPWGRPTRYSKAILGDFAAIGDAEVADIPPEGLTAWAAARLVEAIGAEVVHLREHRATIDVGRIAADRAEAVALGSLDPGKEGAVAQRYVAAAGRDLSRTLRDLHLVESRSGIDPAAESDADPAPVAPPEPVAASGADSEPGVATESIVDEPVAAPLASFGKAQSVAPLAAPVAVAHPIRPVHTVEPALYYPTIGR